MILAAGLSPAWQQIMRFDSLRGGEVNRACEVRWCASGKAINVARALHSLASETVLISTAGGLTGRALRADVEHSGIQARWIETAAPTRVCTTVLDTQNAEITELVENAPGLMERELQAFQDAYFAEVRQASLVVLTGSLPAATRPQYYAELLERTSCPAVLDFRGRELWEALPFRPLLVKPNREELSQTVKRPLPEEADVFHATQELHARGAQWVAVTNGGGPMLVSGPAARLRVTPPRVPVVNAIAAGDCLAAGIAWAIAAGKPLEEAIGLGVAAAAFNVTQLLPAELDRPAVERLAAAVQIEHL